MSEKWFNEKLKILGCASTKELTFNKCKVPVKDELAKMIHGALLHIDTLHRQVNDLQEERTELQEKLDESL